jgi:hypothetical protein
VESACQLLGQAPAAKYDGSVEAVARLIRQYSTNSKIQLMPLVSSSAVRLVNRQQRITFEEMVAPAKRLDCGAVARIRPHK